MIMTILEVEVEIETIYKERSLTPDLTPRLVLIAIKSGVTGAGNTIISRQNALIPQLMRRLTMKKLNQPLYK